MRLAIITEIEIRGKRTDPYRAKEESEEGIKSLTLMKKKTNMRIDLSKGRVTLKIMKMEPPHSSKVRL